MSRLLHPIEFIDYRRARDLREDAAEQLLRERDAANARAEKYLAVIAAMDAERNALSAYYMCHHNTVAAQAAAGYRIGEAPAWQALKDLVKEADHD